jgi:GNAT superfamily N-acetyltransferase
MFATGSLARRIERAEAALVADGAAAADRRTGDGSVLRTPIRGGTAAFTEPSAPFNKVAGLGFEGVPDEAELTAIEEAYAARGCPVLVELSSFAEPAVGRLLTRRGYQLIGYENVSGLMLRDVSSTGVTRPEGLSLARVEDAATAEEWLEAVTTGFLNPDTYDGLPSHESYSRDVARRSIDDMVAAPGVERYVARRSGVVAGGASFRTFEGVAQLCGSATLPEHRRQGVQSALLWHRLEEAKRLGCDLAVVVTSPGSKSQQNVERFGFGLLYVRAILILAAPNS